MRLPNDQILPGDMVFFRCTNPATGRVKRMASDRKWADVEWNDGSGRVYTKRHLTKNMILLCPVLNKYLMENANDRP